MKSLATSHPPGGYHGRYLRIDVTSGQAEYRQLSEKLLREFLGGSGLGTKLLLDEGTATLDPLSPAAPLIFVFSPLVGSPLTTSAKFAVVHKSPLTQRINDSLASSGFAIHGKQTGCDAIVIVGRAVQWSVLVIDDGKVRLESADEFRGQEIPDTEAMLRSRFGRDYNFAVIGPAGENLVPFSTISHAGRHAGRGGAGAVLGSKNIKAIAVRGTQRVKWHNVEKLTAAAKDLSTRSFGPATAKYRELGTAANLLVFNRLKVLPTRNFQRASFAEAPNIAPEAMATAHAHTRSSCVACTIGCEHIYQLGDKSVRMEYENLFALGPLVGVSDAQAVLKASQRCDALGIDTISTGGAIAFAMECVERDLLSAAWLKFGDADALLRAIEELAALKTPLGRQLALGTRALAHELGNDALAFAVQVKGLELPGYEPRALQTLALGLAVGTRGADHNRSSAYEADFSAATNRRALTPESAELAIASEDRAALLDSLILCKFLRRVFTDFNTETAELMRLVTGWDITAQELAITARRIIHAKKQFNILAGWTPAEDTLPERFFSETPHDDATAQLSRTQLAAAIVRYNQLRGWSDEGWIV